MPTYYKVINKDNNYNNNDSSNKNNKLKAVVIDDEATRQTKVVDNSTGMMTKMFLINKAIWQDPYIVE